MYKTTLAIALLFVLFLVMGLLLLATPTNSPRQRLTGALYLAACLLIAWKMHLEIGIVADSGQPKPQSRISHPDPGDAELHQVVSASVEPRFAELGQVGLVVVTIVDGRRDITTFGETAINSGRLPATDTIFEIGSISKLFTAGMLAVAVEQGLLSLDNRVADLLQLPAAAGHQKRDITLGHLVTHTAGMPRMSYDIFRPSQLLAMLAGGNPYALYSSQKVKTLFSRTKLREPPGEQFNYSNTGFGLLGVLLAERFGVPYLRVLQDTITLPLSLADTTSELDARQQLRTAQAYRGYFRLGPLYLAQTATPSDCAEGLVGAAGLRSTGKDMLRFLAAHMNTEERSPFSFLRQTHAVLHKDKTTKVGMGWLSDQLPRSGRSIIYHDGISGGYAGYIGISDDHRIGVVLLGNVSRSMNTLALTLMDDLIAHFPEGNK